MHLVYHAVMCLNVNLRDCEGNVSPAKISTKCFIALTDCYKWKQFDAVLKQKGYNRYETGFNDILNLEIRDKRLDRYVYW